MADSRHMNVSLSRGVPLARHVRESAASVYTALVKRVKTRDASVRRLVFVFERYRRVRLRQRQLTFPSLSITPKKHLGANSERKEKSTFRLTMRHFLLVMCEE